jgi:hypothetical protein
VKTTVAMNAGSATMKGESLWPRLAGLTLVSEASEYEPFGAQRTQRAAAVDASRRPESRDFCQSRCRRLRPLAV